MISKAITLAHSFLVIAENNQYAFAVKPLGYALGVVVIMPLYPSKGSVSVVGLNFVYAHNHVVNITQGVGHPPSYLKELSINFFLDAKWGPRVIGHNGR